MSLHAVEFVEQRRIRIEVVAADERAALGAAEAIRRRAPDNDGAIVPIGEIEVVAAFVKKRPPGTRRGGQRAPRGVLHACK